MPKSYEAKLRQAEESRRPYDEEKIYEPIEGVPQRILVGFDHPESLQFELQTTYVDDTFTIDELHDHLMGEVMKIQHEHNRKPLMCDYSKKHLYFDRLFMRPRAHGREFTLQDYGFRPGYRVKLTPFYGSEKMWGSPIPTKPETQNKVAGPVADPKMMKRIDKGIPAPSRQLFCFPWLGGTLQIFDIIGRSAPRDCAVYAFELPGRGDREMDESYPSGEYLAHVYALTVLPQMKKKPNGNYFYGHSQGSHFAYYTIKILAKEHGIQPKAFFLSNFATPIGRAPRDLSTMRLRQQGLCTLKAFISLVKGGWGLDPKMAYKSHTGMCNYQLEDYWPLSKMIMIDWFQTLDFPLPNSDEPLPCPIHAIHGMQDKAVSRAMIQEWKGYSKDPNSFQVSETDGEHLWWQGNKEKTEWLMQTIDEGMKKFKDK